jgi:hypothetical protein
MQQKKAGNPVKLGMGVDFPFFVASGFVAWALYVIRQKCGLYAGGWLGLGLPPRGKSKGA